MTWSLGGQYPTYYRGLNNYQYHSEVHLILQGIWNRNIGNYSGPYITSTQMQALHLLRQGGSEDTTGGVTVPYGFAKGERHPARLMFSHRCCRHIASWLLLKHGMYQRQSRKLQLGEGLGFRAFPKNMGNRINAQNKVWDALKIHQKEHCDLQNLKPSSLNPKALEPQP